MILVIAGKELRSLFATPLAWVILAILQAVFAYIFLAQLDAFLAVQAQLMQLANPPGVTELVAAPTFGAAGVVLLVSVPALTMRAIADERRQRTLPLLLSAPVSMAEIVLGKYLALVAFVTLLALLVLVMTACLAIGTQLDYGLVLSNLLGLWLLASAFAALGLYVSCLTSHPALAAVGTTAALLLLWLVNVAGGPDARFAWLSLTHRAESFGKGLLDTGDLAFYVLFIGFWLLLAVQRLEAERRS